MFNFSTLDGNVAQIAPLLKRHLAGEAQSPIVIEVHRHPFGRFVQKRAPLLFGAGRPLLLRCSLLFTQYQVADTKQYTVNPISISSFSGLLLQVGPVSRDLGRVPRGSVFRGRGYCL
jgi:hypothetical protein